MTLASFKQCPSCNSSITEAFLDAVLALKHPDILSAFKVFAACMMLLHNLFILQESIFSSCFTQLCSGGSPYALCSCGAVLIAPRAIRNYLRMLLQSYNHWKHENGSVPR